MLTIQIKTRYTSSVLFECEVPDTLDSGLHMRHALEKATIAKANLIGANLRGANLIGANLRGANLIGANLAGANLAGKKLIGDRPFFTIGPIGSRSDYLQAFLTDAGLMIRTGCFFGAKTEFEEKLSEKHGGNDHAQEYRAALVLIGKHAELWTPEGQFIAQEEFPANL